MYVCMLLGCVCRYVRWHSCRWTMIIHPWLYPTAWCTPKRDCREWRNRIKGMWSVSKRESRTLLPAPVDSIFSNYSIIIKAKQSKANQRREEGRKRKGWRIFLQTDKKWLETETKHTEGWKVGRKEGRKEGRLVWRNGKHLFISRCSPHDYSRIFFFISLSSWWTFSLYLSTY